MDKEGWFQDPYRLHQDRWFSQGEPTKLVRDAGVETYDPPPQAPYSGPLARPEPTEAPRGPSDLRRADDFETAPGRSDYVDRAFDVVAEYGPPGAI